eukprot:GHVU01113525.1.p1 GENE.GHVU01113525.1~~GHVU01113525.1.p1  ORF type:complete len:145 (+),score=20.63 GHVU01113525.1:618-1052(+)
MHPIVGRWHALLLLQETWIPTMKERALPMTGDVDPLNTLATDAEAAVWKNEGLPADRISLENAAIATACSRWPLLIDPQMQGVKWVKQRQGEALTSIQFTHDRWLQKLTLAMQSGGVVLIEAVQEEIDPILDPLLSRSTCKRVR